MPEPGHDLLTRFLRLDPRDGAAAEQLRVALDAAVEFPATGKLRDLDLSWFPTARFVQLRFIDAHELDATIRDRFARPCPDLPELAAVFVDPEQLSYHCFENIVGLDRRFDALPGAAVCFRRPRELAPGILQLDTTLADSLAGRLAGLDDLGLFVPPRGRWRGGRRFVFHAAPLADALTAALLEAMPDLRSKGFVHVNPVFRCNRFEPDDAEFASHVDSPFASASRSLVSTQTLLLYLTTGRNPEGALRFEAGPTIDEIRAPTAFVFDQALAHAGSPYVEGPKLFVRTELITRVPAVQRSVAIGQLFAKACWLDAQSVTEPRLEAFANEGYDRAAKAHFLGPQGEPTREPFVHREFAGLHFVTNGLDAFFRRDDVGPIEAAAVMLLELLHATIDGVPFRKLCRSETLVQAGGDRRWIAPFLAQFPPLDEPPFGRLDKQGLFPAPCEEDPQMRFPSSPDITANPYPDDWNPHHSEEVIDALRRAQRWASRRIFAAPITLVGKQVFLDPQRFVIEGNRIHVLSHLCLGPLQFAGAEFFAGHDFLDVDLALDSLHPLVPPISFHERRGVLHLECDMFRNDWLVGHRVETVPIPYVVEGTHLLPNQSPWLEAAARGRSRAEVQTELDEELP